MISVIIPVLAEAASINNMIAHLVIQASEERIEIIVVDGDLDRSTSRVMHLGAALCIASERGRALQMNRGAQVACGHLLLFLHADTLLPEKAFSLIRLAMNEERIVAGAFTLGFNSNRKIFRITEIYARVRTWLTRVPFGDQAIFIRREYFERIGGFKEVPLMEDVDLMKRIRRRGDKIVILPEKVLTSSRRYEQEGIIYCTLRNLVLQFLYMFGVSPGWLAKWYRPHNS